MLEMHKTTFLVIIGAGLAAATSDAFGACTTTQMNGSWHFFAMQSATPAIKNPVNQVVKDGTGANKTIRVFASSGTLFANSTATAIGCQVTVTGASASAANFTGTCRSDGVVAGDGDTGVGITGNVALSTCTVTGGTINVSGDPTPVTFLGGHFFYPSGAGTARQGQSQVILWTMIKN